MNAARAAQPGRARDVHGPPRLLRERQVLEVERLPRAVEERLQDRVQDVPAAFPWVKTYAPWNEANHVSQPTAKSPKRAAEYYDVAARAAARAARCWPPTCSTRATCTTWLQRFIRYSKNNAAASGACTTTRTSTGAVQGPDERAEDRPGRGLADRDRRHHEVRVPASRRPTRAPRRRRSTCSSSPTASTPSSKGYKSKLTRLYVYRWFGEPDGTFDSGLVNPDGSQRPAFDAVREVRQAPPEVALPGSALDLGQPYSDTQTRPTSAMRKAMAEAEVGDEQRFEDPQVTELCARVAALLGMEAAVFLPSGTMCNEIAFRLHIRPGGDEAILHRLSHPIIAEAGGPAAFAGAMMQPLDTPQGHVHGRRRARRAALPGPLLAALAARVRRADDEHGRRARVAAGAAARRRRRSRRSTSCGCTWTARG